ncbi:MAG: aminodeoxychorismate/anthranilate synthase component II [Bacteroidales bacterium]|nr:aminodeoxychorismate/anthranilate synthase component II [Bacteroidales bacterium]
MKILVIDNYDSFTYNLVHYLDNITGTKPDVFRNDKISLEAVGGYDKILLSPGPGIPEEAGICLDVLKKYGPTKSILGVCLGHQAIGEAFGGTLTNLSEVYHGVSSFVKLHATADPLFKNIPARFEVGRYHSWVVNKEGLPDLPCHNLRRRQWFIMGLSHKQFDVKGVQYHPESVLTPDGLTIMKNWVEN